MRDGLGMLEKNAVNRRVEELFLAAILRCIHHLSGKVTVKLVLGPWNNLILSKCTLAYMRSD